MAVTTTPTMNTNMKTWYHSNYPTDEIWIDMDDAATFEDLFDALDHYQDVYETIGVGDSVVRERLFEALAALMGVEYDYVYDQWGLGYEMRRSALKSAV